MTPPNSPPARSRTTAMATRRRRRLLTAALVVPVAALAGLSAGHGSSTRATTPAWRVTAVAVAAPVARTRDVGPGSFTFLTRSRGTACLLTNGGPGGSAECQVRGNTSRLPPRPAGCEFDYGLSVATGPSGSALTCRSDTFYDPAAEVVPYGTTVRSGRLQCTVARTGVTCRDTATGSRFSVSRAAFRLS